MLSFSLTGTMSSSLGWYILQGVLGRVVVRARLVVTLQSTQREAAARGRMQPTAPHKHWPD